MKFIKLLVLTTVLALSPAVFAKKFSDQQIKNMQQAYNYGKSKPLKFTGANNINFGYIMAAIMWQESSAGTNTGAGRHAVGPYQNLITTVKNRMAQDGIKKSRAQISRELSNHDASAKWARIELDNWLGVHDGNITKALASYNAGWKYQKGMRYSASVLSKAKYLKQHNVLKVEKK